MAAAAASQMVATPRLVYLDLDVGDARAAFARAAHFVETNDLKYGLSSKDVVALGGRERQALLELYANDFEAAKQGKCRVTPQPNCRVVLDLFVDDAPLACENFAALVRGDRGTDKGSGVPLYYKNSGFHRVIKGFVMQGGDIVKGNGSGGASVFGKKFKDETKGLKLKHTKAGVLSMGNSGKNSNSSQFFLTFAPCPQLDGKHVIFGRVVAGMDVVRMVESVGGDDPREELPRESVTVTDCGVFVEGTTPPSGYWAPPSADAPRGSPSQFVTPPRIIVLGSGPAAARVAAALSEATPPVRADVLAFAEAADGTLKDALRFFPRAVLLITPAASPGDRELAKKLATDAGCTCLEAKPAACAEKLRPLLSPHTIRASSAPLCT